HATRAQCTDLSSGLPVLVLIVGANRRRRVMRSFKSFGCALAGAATLVLANTALAQKDIVIGLQCDRTGQTQTVGVFLCPGYHDDIALVNSKGGVGGAKIKAVEIDTEYKVPAAVEAYERHKKEGAVL